MVAKLSLVECMATVKDPRMDRTKAHELQDILVLSVLAVLCGAEGWESSSCLPRFDSLGSRSSSSSGMAFLPMIPSVESSV